MQDRSVLGFRPFSCFKLSFSSFGRLDSDLAVVSPASAIADFPHPPHFLYLSEPLLLFLFVLLATEPSPFSCCGVMTISSYTPLLRTLSEWLHAFNPTPRTFPRFFPALLRLVLLFSHPFQGIIRVGPFLPGTLFLGGFVIRFCLCALLPPRFFNSLRFI